jgi:hypothetical protein
VDTFQVAAGSILGRDHLLIGKNNQDSYHFIQNPQHLVAVVCDGCGSSPYTEVGAHLGARLIATEIHQLLLMPRWSQPWSKVELQFSDDHSSQSNRISTFHRINALLERVKADTLAEIRLLAKGMGDDFTKIIEDYFFFTVVGAVVTPAVSFFFHLGDGVIKVNGKSLPLTGSVAQNAPAYLAYNLVNSEAKTDLSFRLPILESEKRAAFFITPEIQSFLIGSDGVGDLENASSKNLPGRDVYVGELSQLWMQDRFFQNPDNVRRHLTLVNREVTRPNWENQIVERDTGHLRDDTTLVVARRK